MKGHKSTKLIATPHAHIPRLPSIDLCGLRIVCRSNLALESRPRAAVTPVLSINAVSYTAGRMDGSQSTISRMVGEFSIERNETGIRRDYGRAFG